MCVAYPGTVIRTYDEGRKATVDFSGTRTEVQTGFIPVRENDRVLVHAGCVLQVLPKEEAEAMDEIFAEIRAMEQEAEDGQKKEEERAGSLKSLESSWLGEMEDSGTREKTREKTRETESAT